MPLKIKMKPGEKIIVNGAVLENTGPEAMLAVHNRAKILRSRDIITEAEANTPARKIYFAIQGAYIFSETEDTYLELFNDLLLQYIGAAPSAAALAAELRALVDSREYYQALRTATKLIAHEDERVAYVKERGSGLRQGS
ncbi:MAG TPA: flagellar biosynthesis repressor FlbT [Alphaproteobacteria bacterium]|nr:flagellar biosynthesis repressor FlbT [Alphaproteobacteria bacterium]